MDTLVERGMSCKILWASFHEAKTNNPFIIGAMPNFQE